MLQILQLFWDILHSHEFSYPCWCSKSLFNIIITPKASATLETKKAFIANKETPARASSHHPTCEATKNAGTKICIVFFSCRPRPSLKKFTEFELQRFFSQFFFFIVHNTKKLTLNGLRHKQIESIILLGGFLHVERVSSEWDAQ